MPHHSLISRPNSARPSLTASTLFPLRRSSASPSRTFLTAGAVSERYLSMRRAVRSPKTRPSSKEFDANLLAPCMPVLAVSPQA